MHYLDAGEVNMSNPNFYEKSITQDCKQCKGTGLGEIRVENSKCFNCKGIGFFKVPMSQHECEYSGNDDCDICPECQDHTQFCDHCAESECCGHKPYYLD
jgi:hypothetical protein